MTIQRTSKACLAITALFLCCAGASAQSVDPRLREVQYDAATVITVPVRVGVVTMIVLDAEEGISEVASGIGGDCAKPEAAWCIAAQPGGRTLFVKPKSSARTANNVAVVTDKRSHSFRFVILAEGDRREPVYRLVVRAQARAPTQSAAAAAPALPPSLPFPPLPALPSPREVVAERIKAKPLVVNAEYSIAAGATAADIVPSLIFDDGRFTYLRLPGNREVPAAFHVLADGTETIVNARMEDDLLVVDRVSRRLVLRAGSAVVGIWNDAFDLEGLPPADGTTVAGVRRSLRSEGSVRRLEQKHE